jgi:hypothetical protein
LSKQNVSLLEYLKIYLSNIFIICGCGVDTRVPNTYNRTHTRLSLRVITYTCVYTCNADFCPTHRTCEANTLFNKKWMLNEVRHYRPVISKRLNEHCNIELNSLSHHISNFNVSFGFFPNLMNSEVEPQKEAIAWHMWLYSINSSFLAVLTCCFCISETSITWTYCLHEQDKLIICIGLTIANIYLSFHGTKNWLRELKN